MPSPYNPFTWQPGDYVPEDIMKQYQGKAGASAATPATGSQPDLTNRLLQIMSGQLGGTLTGGEKLSALGALLKSVSRGSQTSPQDVVRGIQQQKMAEVQGALQIQELRKAAAKQAQTEAYRQQLVDAEQDPQRKAYLQIASADAIDKIAALQFESKDNLDGIRAQLADLYGFGTQDYRNALKAVIEKQQTYTDASGRTWQIQPVSLPSLRQVATPTETAPPTNVTPDMRNKALAILQKRKAI